MVRVIVIVVAVFIGIYLLSRWLDKRQPSPDDDAVVSDGAGKVLIIIASVVAILLFSAYTASFWCQFCGPFSNLAEFLTTYKNAFTVLTDRILQMAGDARI